MHYIIINLVFYLIVYIIIKEKIILKIIFSKSRMEFLYILYKCRANNIIH